MESLSRLVGRDRGAPGARAEQRPGKEAQGGAPPPAGREDGGASLSQAAPAYDGSEIAVVGMAGRFPGRDGPRRLLEEPRVGRGVDHAVLRAGAPRRPARTRSSWRIPATCRPGPSSRTWSSSTRPSSASRRGKPRSWIPSFGSSSSAPARALEHAGYDPERLPGRASLFAGASFSNYLVHNLYKNRPVMEAFGDMQATILNVQDSLVTMVGYKLNLKGACCAVQTFCSTSLVGVHLASQNLLNYESDVTLAGGVTVYVPQNSGYLYEEGSILSRRGTLPRLRRASGRHGLRQRRGGGGPPTPRGRAPGRGHGACRDPRLGGEQRRLPEGQLRGAGSRRPDGGGGGGAFRSRRRRGNDRLRRDPRHGHAPRAILSR